MRPVGSLRREVFLLIAVVLIVDAIFMAAYFLAGIRETTDTAKAVFTAAWTLATLLIVLRGLSRIRGLR
jgi:hypothetical protein